MLINNSKVVIGSTVIIKLFVFLLSRFAKAIRIIFKQTTHSIFAAKHLAQLILSI